MDLAAHTTRYDELRALLAEVRDHPGDTEREGELRKRLSALAQAGALPLRKAGRALFVVERGPDSHPHVSGSFDEWDPEGLPLEPAGRSGWWFREYPTVPGLHEYKFRDRNGWFLDPGNRAYAYDDFKDNAERRNSVVNMPHSKVGHLEELGDIGGEDGVCARKVRAYLPPGADFAPEGVRYPVLLMHDGQNVFDDPQSGMGHGGWNLNRTLDELIAKGAVEPLIVLAIDNTPDRDAEYLGHQRRSYSRMVIREAMPLALATLPADDSRWGVGGSSFGAAISLEIVSRHPERFQRLALLSGSFGPHGVDGPWTPNVDALQAVGPSRVYLDHGGDAGGADNYRANRELRDWLTRHCGYTLIDLGAGESVPPSATEGFTQAPPGESPTGRWLGYWHDPRAPHNETAWRKRAATMLRFLYPSPVGG